MRTLRAGLISPSFGRRLLVALLASAAIIAGLLAMHTLNAQADDASTTTVVSATTLMPDHSVHAAGQAGAVECGSSCPSDMPPHDMSVMACVLALLLLVLVVDIPMLSRLAVAAAPPGPASQWLSTAIAAQPPSLRVLSISRI